jgi:hypothetical protein
MAKLSSYNSHLAPGNFLHAFEFTFVLRMRRVYRVQGFLSSRPIRIGPPPPMHPQASVVPPFGSRGGHTRLLESGRWGGGANSDEVTDTLEL